MPLTPVLEDVMWQPANPSPGGRADITLTHSTEGSGGTKPIPAAEPRRVIDVLLFTPDLTGSKLVEIGIALLENETDTTTVPFDVPQAAGEYTMRLMYFDDGDQIPPRVLNNGTMVVGDVESNESSISVGFQSAVSPSKGRVLVRYDVKNEIVSGGGQTLTPTIETTIDGTAVDTYNQPTEPGETIPVVRQVDGITGGDREVCVRVV